MIGRILGVLAILWSLGFVVFMLTLAKPLGPSVTDGIVVPTGGAGRIDRGLALLADHQAKRMLVSGVGPQVRPIDLAHEYHVSPRLFACCIDLGSEATDTRSNGEETAEWVRTHGYRSVRLVTSDWHMARARLELTKALGPGVEVLADGVPSSPRLGLLVSEYHKYLLRRLSMATGIGR